MDMSVVCLRMIQDIKNDPSGNAVAPSAKAETPSTRSSFPEVEKMVLLAVKSLNIACFWATNGLWHMRHNRNDQVRPCNAQLQCNFRGVNVLFEHHLLLSTYST